jgi:hypothetical protein
LRFLRAIAAALAGCNVGVGSISHIESNISLPRYGSREAQFDLAEAPLPAYELLDPALYNRLTVQTSRGCPFRCDFCASSISATAVGEDGRTTGEACAVLLAAAGGRAPEPAAVRGDAAAHSDAAGARRIVEVKPAEQQRNRSKRGKRGSDVEEIASSKGNSGVEARGEGNSGLAETTGDDRNGKTRQIGPKEGNWVYTPDRAGFKMEIPANFLSILKPYPVLHSE